MSENADITSIEPYVAVAVNDTLDETRTDLPALIQRMENQIALQNQVIRQFLEHWDSISRLQFSGSVKKLFITRHQESGDPVLEYTFSDGTQNYKRL